MKSLTDRVKGESKTLLGWELMKYSVNYTTFLSNLKEEKAIVREN